MINFLSSVGVIGGADGPTTILVSGPLAQADAGFWGWLALGCLIAYLLGSVDFGIVVSKLLYKDDIRTHGSGNAGATNILRTFGWAGAILTALGDIAKSAIAVTLVRWLVTNATGVPELGACAAYVSGLFAVFGHLWPIWFKFKGGKGVATAAGAILATAPLVVLALAVVFFLMVVTTRIVSLSSITVAALYPVFTFFYSSWRGYDVGFTTLCALIMGGLVIWMHRANIKRLLNGTEYKFGQKK